MHKENYSSISAFEWKLVLEIMNGLIHEQHVDNIVVHLGQNTARSWRLDTAQQFVVNLQQGETELEAPCTGAIKLFALCAAIHLFHWMIFSYQLVALRQALQ